MTAFSFSDALGLAYQQSQSGDGQRFWVVEAGTADDPAYGVVCDSERYGVEDRLLCVVEAAVRDKPCAACTNGFPLEEDACPTCGRTRSPARPVITDCNYCGGTGYNDTLKTECGFCQALLINRDEDDEDDDE